MTEHEQPASRHWPALLYIRAHVTVSNVAVAVVMGWLALLAIDVDVFGLGIEPPSPLWGRLYNDGPVEWLQWFLLAGAVFAAAYLASRLWSLHASHAARFFTLLSIGAALMLIEDAGDIRHELGRYVVDTFGSRVAGLPINLFAEVPYFAALAAVPIYAVIRYGSAPWQVSGVRPYLVGAYGLYGLAAASSSLRVVGGNYTRLGAWIDETILGARWPSAPGETTAHAHFYLVDGPIEESIEVLAAACLFALVLAFTAAVRRGEVVGGAVADDQRPNGSQGGADIPRGGQ